jgi:hypothetical protein
MRVAVGVTGVGVAVAVGGIKVSVGTRVGAAVGVQAATNNTHHSACLTLGATRQFAFQFSRRDTFNRNHLLAAIHTGHDFYLVGIHF